MNRYVVFPILFILACLGAIESKAYIAFALGFLAATICLADLKPFGKTIANNRGRTVIVLAALMVLALGLKI